MNVLHAIRNGADGQLDELHAERAKLVDRLADVNDDIARLETAKLAAGASRQRKGDQQEGQPS